MSDKLHHSDVPSGYPELLEEIVQRVARSQTRAALAVSRELVLLYWSERRSSSGRELKVGAPG